MSRKKNSRGHKQPKPPITPKTASVTGPHDKNPSAVAVRTKYSGPIPAAQELGNYDLIVPGAAERILTMAENNQKHLCSMEELALRSARSEAKRGQVFALIVTVMAFGTSIFALALDKEAAAIALGSTTIVGLAVAFITGRKERGKTNKS